MSKGRITQIVASICVVPVVALSVIHWKYGLRFRSYNLMNKHIKSNVQHSLNYSHDTPNTFKILSQNIWGIFLFAPKRKKRFKLLIQKLKKEQPEIVLLQELFIGALYPFMVCGDFEFIHSELINLGYIYYNDPLESLPSYFGLNSGLMIYSKLKTKQHHSYSFNKKYQRFPIQRGYISTVISLNSNDDLFLINNHFDPNIKEYQLNSMKELSNNKYIKHNANEYKYVVCGGDFNICTDSAMYETLFDEMNVIGLNHDLFDDETQPTFRPNYNDKYPDGATFDHIFINNNLKQINKSNHIKDWKTSDYVVSDHYGLMSFFAIS